MKRIAIIGSSGSGKSTLARTLGEILQMEVFHLDQLFWKPGWVLATKEEQKRIQDKLTSKEKWIFDGTYTSTLDLRLRQADAVIYLDLSRILCTYRVLKRRLQYHNKTRPDMGEGCKEKIDWEFLKYVWHFPKTKKPVILKYLKEKPHNQQVIILSSPGEIEHFIYQIKESVA
ncbi:Adenylate kinase [Salinibacillus kushneri]|uniref:Adenylate kinase n=1 Tax=Salinibacillus kushneri TaxID=237682 RepID=A0A1I0F5U7_9BACI|nr:DNA topology modulation protein [Salinibacillus kushneri]SET53063.1 Adenylate kinase [Salinibacillus kushneri]